MWKCWCLYLRLLMLSESNLSDDVTLESCPAVTFQNTMAWCIKADNGDHGVRKAAASSSGKTHNSLPEVAHHASVHTQSQTLSTQICVFDVHPESLCWTVLVWQDVKRWVSVHKREYSLQSQDCISSVNRCLWFEYHYLSKDESFFKLPVEFFDPRCW